MFIKLIQHNGSICSLFQFNYHTHSGVIGFIICFCNSINFLISRQFPDCPYHQFFIDLIGNLCHHDSLMFFFCFDFRLGAQNNLSTPRLVCLTYTGITNNLAACRKIRAFDILHQLFNTDFRIIYAGTGRINNFSKIVRRNIGCHTYSNTAGTVDQKIGESGRQRYRLLQRSIKVWIKIHRILINIPHQFHGNFSKACFGITHSRSAVTIDGAKVAMPIYQQISGREILCHAHHTIINCRIAMGVIFTQHISYNTCAFFMRFIRCNSLFGHGVDDSSMHRLQSISHIRQSTVNNNRHCIGNERFFHLSAQIQRNNSIMIHFVFHVFFSHQISRLSLSTILEFSSIKARRGSTSSPIRISNSSSASIAFSKVTCISVRF